jgi:hypothetical protein
MVIVLISYVGWCASPYRQTKPDTDGRAGYKGITIRKHDDPDLMFLMASGTVNLRTQDKTKSIN